MISISFNSSLLFIFKLYYQYKISFNLVFVMQWSNRWFNFALYIYEATRLVKCKKLLENFLFEQFLLELFLSCQLISPQVNSTYSIFYIFATTCSRIPNIFLTHDFILDFYTLTNIYHYSIFDLSYIFYYQIYIYICMIYVLLMFFTY